MTSPMHGGARRRSALLQARSRKTRQAIVHAALHLWSHRGFEETTVQEICTLAGVSKGLFYFYFQRKEDLLVELGWQSAEAVAADASRLLAAEDYDIRAVLGALIQAMVSRADRNSPALVARTVLEVYRSSQHTMEMRDERSAVNSVFEMVFLDGSRRGKLPADIDPAMLARMVSTLILEGLRQWGAGLLDGVPLAADLEQQIDLLLDGVANSPDSTKPAQSGPQ